jgi:hypothetical protein
MSHLHPSLNIRFILVAFPPTSAAYANLLLLWCGLISTHPSWLESCHRVDYRSKKNPGGFPARIIGRVVEVRFKKIRCKDSYEKSRPGRGFRTGGVAERHVGGSVRWNAGFVSWGFCRCPRYAGTPHPWDGTSREHANTKLFVLCLRSEFYVSKAKVRA